MAGNYEKSTYNQLMEIMARLDTVEADLLTEKTEHKDDVDHLNAKIDGLTQENQLLRNDNARLKSIIDNDSSNTYLADANATTVSVKGKASCSLLSTFYLSSTANKFAVCMGIKMSVKLI